MCINVANLKSARQKNPGNHEISHQDTKAQSFTKGFYSKNPGVLMPWGQSFSKVSGCGSYHEGLS
jgi:hypothetical protein